jgi:hypothetical protein
VKCRSEPLPTEVPGAGFLPRMVALRGCWKGGALQAAGKPIETVILRIDTLSVAHDGQKRGPRNKPEDGEWGVAPSAGKVPAGIQEGQCRGHSGVPKGAKVFSRPL